MISLIGYELVYDRLDNLQWPRDGWYAKFAQDFAVMLSVKERRMGSIGTPSGKKEAREVLNELMDFEAKKN